MGDISKEELRKEVAAILKDADLASMSAKKVRQQIEEKLDIDLTSRKKEVDDIVMECLKASQEKSKNSKKNGKEDDEEDEEEDEEEDAEEEEDEEEEEEPPKKKAAPAKKPPAKRAKKSSSEEESEGGGGSEEEGSEDEDSDAPKKSKGAKKGKGPGRKKKKGSDSDSDEDWAKSRSRSSGGGGGGRKKGGGAKKGGGGGKGSGYTRAYTLSPELSDLLGEESMPRHEVVKRIWALIKEKNLYDPKNKQFAICDEPLLKVIGQKRFRIFGMMKHLKNHFLD